MKHYKKQQREVSVLEMVTCNLCGNTIEDGSIKWNDNVWDGMCASFELELTGSRYGWIASKTWSADFCFECSQKVIELLSKAGVAIEEKAR